MAWGKKEQEQENSGSRPTEAPAEPKSQGSAPARDRESKKMRNLVHIGKSVQIKGELTGSEDVTVDGTVEGKITITDHGLTIGSDGRIKADILAKSVVITGEVVGNGSG